MNKKQAKTLKRGYREAGQLYWTDEMAKILRTKDRVLKAYRAGFYIALSIAAFVAFVYIKAYW